MNNNVKNTIARKLAVRLSAVLTIAFILLLAGAFFTLRRDVRTKCEHYTKAIVGVYSDIVAYVSEVKFQPNNEFSGEKFAYFGDYLCSWYLVDYIYGFIPDFEKGTITYISVSRDKDKYGDVADDHMQGVTEEYVLNEDELKAWNTINTYAIKGNNRFGKNTDVMLAVTDRNGNKAMIGAAMSSEEMEHDALMGFLIVGGFMFIIVLVLAFLLYHFLKKMVSDPARRISQKMSDYISGHKRSAIKLETDDEFAMMAGAFNHMTEEIDNYINDIARLGREKERQQAEVDIASDIQKGILSSGNAFLGNGAVKAIMKPAKFVGGDLYDYLELDKSHTLTVIGDVSGKGISSAMLMAVVLTLIRQFAKLGYSPAGILNHVNASISEENPRMMFITAFVGIFDSESGILTYANAGHNPPYLLSDGLNVLDKSEGTPLGLFQGEEYTDVRIAMNENDTLFVYTDGVNEAVNSAGEFFGTERLEKLLKETAETKEKDYVGSVEAAVLDFADGAEQNDDITILSLTARKNPEIELDYDIRQFSVIRDILFSSGLPQNLIMGLCVAAEECFVNICSYAFDGNAPEGEKIRFYFEFSNKVLMRFTDGGKRFDPRRDLPDTEEYDIDTAVGGMGRLIAFSVADSVDYEYKDGKNILTIKKSIK